MATKAGVTVQFQVSEETAGASAVPRQVMADPSRLRQMLMILLDNAIGYSRPGQVVPRVRQLIL